LLGTSDTDTKATTFTFQVGANSGQTLAVSISAMNASAIGLTKTVDIVANPRLEQTILHLILNQPMLQLKRLIKLFQLLPPSVQLLVLPRTV
jgi:hypothetical protein